MSKRGIISFLVIAATLPAWLTGALHAQECAPTPEGLVAWWPWDGNAGDLTGNHPGILQNGAAFAPGFVTAGSGQALWLDGLDDYVGVPDSSVLEPTRYTFSVWVSVNSQPPPMPPTKIILQKGTNDGNIDRSGYTFDYRNVAGVNKVSVNHVDSSNGFQQLLVPQTLLTGQWHYLAATYDGSALRIYVDGELGGLLATSIDPDYGGDGQTLKIGVAEGFGGILPGREFDGLLDDLQIFGRALSPSEIAAIYEAGTAGLCRSQVVGLDIKPGSYPNSINPDSPGVTPVAILGSAALDVAEIDPPSLAFGPEQASPWHRKGGHYEDVNDDDVMDLLSHYETRATGITRGDTAACVSGHLFDGTPITGCDTLKTIGGSNRRKWEASSDFSTTQGENDWWYLYWDGTSYSQMVYGINHWGNESWHDPIEKSATWRLSGSALTVHTAPSFDAALTWVAPYAGRFGITGNVRKAWDPHGDGVAVRILKESELLWHQVIEGDDQIGFDFNLETSLAAGERVYFVVNKNSTNLYDTTFLDAAIKVR